VIIESRAVQGRALGDVLHADRVERLLGQKALNGLEKHLPSTADAWVNLDAFSSHKVKIPFDGYTSNAVLPTYVVLSAIVD